MRALILALVVSGCGEGYEPETDAGVTERDAGVAVVDAGCDAFCQREAARVYCETRGEGCPYEAKSCVWMGRTCVITYGP